MLNLDKFDPKNIAYAYGYLEVTLGSTRDLQPEHYRNRIAYALSVMRGEPDPTLVAVEPPLPELEEEGEEI